METKTSEKRILKGWKWHARKAARTQLYAAIFGTVPSSIDRVRGQRADAGAPWSNLLRVVIDGEDETKTAYWQNVRRMVQELWKIAQFTPPAARAVLEEVNRHIHEPLTLADLNK